MKRIRVAQVTLSMGQGGIENLILSLIENQDAKKFESFLYCLDQGGELLGQLGKLEAPPRIFGRKPGLDLRLIVHLARAFRRDGIDVVHTHNQAAHFYGCLAARLARVPVVLTTEHSRHYIDEHWRRRLEKTFLTCFTDRIITVSEELKHASITRDRVPGSKIEVVVNGVDVERFDSLPEQDVVAFKQSLGIFSNSKVVGIVARLHPVKNHRLLFQAFALALKTIPEFYLVVVGDGELRQELELFARDLGIAHRLKFLGSRTDIPLLMKAFDTMVLCSHTEGMPLVLLEGMAAGTPLLVTEGANLSGIIMHGTNGIVCRGEEEDLAQNLISILMNGVDISGLRAAGKKMIINNYSIGQVIGQYNNLYESLVS